MNLYRVILRGMTTTWDNTAPYGDCYVISDSADDAYHQVRTYLDKEKIGWDRERVLDRVELVAATGSYPRAKYRLFISQE